MPEPTMFIAVLKTACYPFLFCARQIQSMPFQPTSLRSILVSFLHLCLSLLCDLFYSGFPTKIFYTLFSSPMHAIWSTPVILLDFFYLMICGDEHKLQIMKLPSIQLFPSTHYFIPLGFKYYISAAAGMFFLQFRHAVYYIS
jgi:hypothetical protein